MLLKLHAKPAQFGMAVRQRDRELVTEESSRFHLARMPQGSGGTHPSFLVPKTFCVRIEAIGLSLQSAQLLLLFREGGTKGRLGALQLQDGFVAVLSVLVKGRERNGRFWFFSSAAFPAIFPELFFFFSLTNVQSLSPVQCGTRAGSVY